MPPIDQTHDPKRRSWVTSANGHLDFPIQNLPLGIFSTLQGGLPRAGVAIGDMILDLAAAQDACLLDGEAGRAVEATAGGTLNPLFALGAGTRRALRARLSDLLTQGSTEASAAAGMLHRAADCTMHVPAHIGDYTDFYVGINHATNIGKLFRPDNPLLPHYKYVPIAYHGRASSVVPSGMPIRRPNGQRKYRTSRHRASVRVSGSITSWSWASGSGPAHARRADPDQRGARAHRRLLSAERLVGARRTGLGIPAARPFPREELRQHHQPVGHHARGAGALPHAAIAAPGGRSGPAPLFVRRFGSARGGAGSRARSAAAHAGAQGEGPESAPAVAERHAPHVLDGRPDGGAPHRQRLQSASRRSPTVRARFQRPARRGAAV